MNRCGMGSVKQLGKLLAILQNCKRGRGVKVKVLQPLHLHYHHQKESEDSDTDPETDLETKGNKGPIRVRRTVPVHDEADDCKLCPLMFIGDKIENKYAFLFNTNK